MQLYADGTFDLDGDPEEGGAMPEQYRERAAAVMSSAAVVQADRQAYLEDLLDDMAQNDRDNEDAEEFYGSTQ